VDSTIVGVEHMKRRTLVFCILALIVPGSAVHALPRPWLGISGSVNTYEMNDVNAQIREIDLNNLDEIGDGFAFGLHAGLSMSPLLNVVVGYGFLTARTEVGGVASQFDYNLPAHAFQAGLELRAPTPGPFKLGVGVAAGMVSSAGDLVLAVAGVGDLVGEISGSGPLFEGYAVADFWFSPIMALSPSVGYRYAKISEVKVNGTTLYNLDGSEYSLDYSGYFARLTFKIGFP
jgi:hypothetical protein